MWLQQEKVCESDSEHCCRRAEAKTKTEDGRKEVVQTTEATCKTVSAQQPWASGRNAVRLTFKKDAQLG